MPGRQASPTTVEQGVSIRALAGELECSVLNLETVNDTRFEDLDDNSIVAFISVCEAIASKFFMLAVSSGPQEKGPSALLRSMYEADADSLKRLEATSRGYEDAEAEREFKQLAETRRLTITDLRFYLAAVDALTALDMLASSPYRNMLLGVFRVAYRQIREVLKEKTGGGSDSQ